MEAALWVIPGVTDGKPGSQRMKSGQEHRVPLSAAAIELLRGLPQVGDTSLVFPSSRKDVPLSDMTLSALMKRMDFKDKAGVTTVPHGLRSTFRDCVAERTDHPNEVAEMALGHAIGSKVDAAYRRGDLLDKRRRMMNEWADFLDKGRDLSRLLPGEI